MPYYKNDNLLFIHIPKTGGTNIENELKKKSPETLFSYRHKKITEPPHNNVSLQHQLYTTIYKFKNEFDINFDNIKIFCVVRNPYDRIISDLLYLRLIREDFTSEQVYNIIKNKYLHSNYLDNHNIPQYKFITDENINIIKNIKIFKTETLNDSNDQLNDFIGFDINIKKNVSKDYSKYLNLNSIQLINEFYKKDFELFNYEIKKNH